MSTPKVTESRPTCNVAEDAWSDPARSRHLDVPRPTVEALMYSLRDGVVALKRPANMRRFYELSEPQVREVVVRLQKFRAHIARPWTPGEIAILVAARKKLRHG